MKNRSNLAFFVGFSLLLICSFLAGRCTRTKEIKDIKVIIPSVSGKSDTITNFVKIFGKEKDSIIFKDKTIITENPINTKLTEDYINLEKRYSGLELDTERLKKYIASTTINEYDVPFEDSVISILGKVKTQGELVSLQYNYNIKERKVTIPISALKPKERIFSLNIGAGLTTTKQLDKLDPSVNLDLTGKKGNILSASYSLNGIIGVKYTINLFNIKK